MRIVFFTDTYYPQINGVTKSIELFAEQLRKNGHEVHIFCPDGMKKQKYIHQIPSSQFISYPEYRIGLPNLKIISEVKKIRPDIIHIHSPFSVGVTGMAVAKILNIPIVATYHTLLSEYFGYMNSSIFDKSITDKYTAWFFDRASVIIAPSIPIKNILRKCKIKKHIEVLPTPINLSIIKKTINNNGKLTVLHVGRLCKEKRIDIVLRSFEKICKKIDSRLIITSDGPDRKRLEELCKELEIDKNVEFTGFVSDKDLIKIYSSADVFVSASDTETQGLVILEAMACGCPVIVRNALGFKDFIKNKENGILFEKEDELARDILLVKEDGKLREKLIRNGYETVRRFKASNYSSIIEDLYKKASGMKKDSKIAWKALYFSYLIFGSLEFLIIKYMRIPVNSRFLNLHLRFFKEAFFFERLR